MRIGPLVKILEPSDYTEGMLKSFLSLADVMPTGYHAARVANVCKVTRWWVSRDGAVCGYRSQNAWCICVVLMSRHQDRQQMALESGATAVVAEREVKKGLLKVRGNPWRRSGYCS